MHYISGRDSPAGGILVFCPGKREVEIVARGLFERLGERATVHVIHSGIERSVRDDAVDGKRDEGKRAIVSHL